MYNALRSRELVEVRCLFGSAHPKIAWHGVELHCIMFRLGVGKRVFLLEHLMETSAVNRAEFVVWLSAWL